ncbi:MAG: hypothetical protein ABGZ23_23715 [Fuerstiella sp.]
MKSGVAMMFDAEMIEDIVTGQQADVVKVRALGFRVAVWTSVPCRY